MTSYNKRRGLEHLASARAAVREASTGPEGASARVSQLRIGLKRYWDAMNWLDESDPAFLEAHGELHTIGRRVRTESPAGCTIEPDEDGELLETCPASLAHNRFGMSAGFTGDAVCSICNSDASECEHLPEDTVLIAARCYGGRCNICVAAGCEDHIEGEVYEADMVVVVTEVHLREISIVEKPAQPDARITAVSITAADLARHLGRSLGENECLICDKCLAPCAGFKRLGSNRPDRSVSRDPLSASYPSRRLPLMGPAPKPC